ncbi:MAG TPA: hypothetical protein VMU61_13585 [Candidatus Aquilonibacter sp.]|nr:hypothetical protein [Candidatus Aquilonibacter sp.]
MNRILNSALCCLLLAAPLLGQAAPQTLYSESFRHGSTRITEESFEVKLNSQNAVYHERIKDARGADRYVLSILSLGPVGDTKITSWQVKLADLHHSIYDNILLASQSPAIDPTTNLWWLTPGRYAAISINSRRIIRVDGFYVVLQVKGYHFTPPDSPYLDSMTVDVQFTNTDPRGGKNP